MTPSFQHSNQGAMPFVTYYAGIFRSAARAQLYTPNTDITDPDITSVTFGPPSGKSGRNTQIRRRRADFHLRTMLQCIPRIPRRPKIAAVQALSIWLGDHSSVTNTSRVNHHTLAVTMLISKWESRPISDIALSLDVALAPSENGRFIVRHMKPDVPFFYLGDTAWETFHRLDLDDAKVLLRNRAAKGFNVIMAVVLSEQEFVV